MPSSSFARSIASLDDDDIIACTGAAVWARGLAAYRAGKVVETKWEDGDRLVGRVRDGALTYKTRIVPQPARPGISCACPIGVDCAHGVATVIACREDLRGRALAEEAPWKRALATMIGTAASGGEPLGLLVDAHDPSAPIWLKPLRRGTRTAWTDKRAGWPDLTNTRWESVTEGINPTHLSLMREAYRRSREGGAWRSRGEVSLESLGDGAFDWLRRLQRAGVALWAGMDPLTPLELEHTTWDVDLDASLGPDALTLRAVARDGDRVERLPRIAVEPRLLVSKGGTALARVNGVSLLDALPEGGAVDVPVADLAEFRASWLPGLRRRAHVVSLDSTFADVEGARAAIVATVRLEGGDRVAVRWWAEYDFGAAPSRVPLAGAMASDPGLASRAERIDALGAPLSGDGLWRPVPSTARIPAWRAPAFLDAAVGALADAGVVWDIADEVRRIRVDDDGMRVTAVVDDSGTDWFGLRLEVTVAGAAIAMEDVLAALARGEDHVLVDGTWVALDGERVERLRALLAEAAVLTDSDAGSPRISAAQAGLWGALSESADHVRASERWRRAVGLLLDGTDGPSGAGLAVSPALTARLRPYQRAGHDWLTARAGAGLGGVLADDMGLGKTVQLLSAVHSLRDADPEAPPVLVVAPTSVLGAWEEEARRFAPDLDARVVAGTARRRGTSVAEECAGAHLVITSYTIARLEAGQWAAQEFSGLVVDEAQTVKNPRTAVHAALAAVRAPWCFAVTGTPVENSVADLWSVLALACPGLLPRWEVFNERIRKPVESGRDPAALDRLRRLIAPFVLRRTKEEVAPDLPDKVETLARVELGEEHRHIYEQHLTRERARALSLMEDFPRNRMDVLASITRLRQLALDPALVDGAYAHVGSAKTEYLVGQLVQIVPRGHQALVFSQFTSFLARIRRALERRGITVAQLDGATRGRARVIERFRSGAASVFLISLKAGGTGLTLTEADYVYVMDPWWNPAAEAQAVDRAHRIGQSKKVNVYRLVADDTIEAKVVELQDRKRRLVSKVVDGAAAGASLGAEDLRALLE